MPDDPKQPIAPEVSATACEALTALCVSKVRARAPVHGCFSSPSVPLPPLFVISHNSDLHSSCPHCPHCLQNATNRPSATPRSLSLALSLSLDLSLSRPLLAFFFVPWHPCVQSSAVAVASGGHLPKLVRLVSCDSDQCVQAAAETLSVLVAKPSQIRAVCRARCRLVQNRKKKKNNSCWWQFELGGS